MRRSRSGRGRSGRGGGRRRARAEGRWGIGWRCWSGTARLYDLVSWGSWLRMRPGRRRGGPTLFLVSRTTRRLRQRFLALRGRRTRCRTNWLRCHIRVRARRRRQRRARRRGSEGGRLGRSWRAGRRDKWRAVVMMVRTCGAVVLMATVSREGAGCWRRRTKASSWRTRSPTSLTRSRLSLRTSTPSSRHTSLTCCCPPTPAPTRACRRVVRCCTWWPSTGGWTPRACSSRQGPGLRSGVAAVKRRCTWLRPGDTVC